MDELEKTQLYHTAWKHWGVESQIDMLIEEMAELTQVILKTRRNGVAFSFAISEEMADVLICLEQFEARFKEIPMATEEGTMWDQVLRIKESKLQRLYGRLMKSIADK